MISEAVLVTGGAGFIGSCFVRQWLTSNSGTLINLDKLTYAASLESLDAVRDDPRHVFQQGDVADRTLVSRLMAEHRPRAVLHFAAESHVDRSIDAPDPFFATNVLGSYNLLKSSLAYWRQLPADERDRFRFLYVSTDEIYGSAVGNQQFVENSPIAPNSPYAASKAAAGHFLRAFHQTYGLPILQTASTNNYGPYQFPEKLVPLVILNALEGKPLPVYGDGQHRRQWLFVEDHCEALMVLLERGQVGETYHIGGEESLANIDLVRQVCSIIDQRAAGLPCVPCSSLIEFVTDRPGHDRCYALDDTKLRAELGWEPRHSLATGLERTVQWYLENTAWVAAVGERYGRERLGLSRDDTKNP